MGGRCALGQGPEDKFSPEKGEVPRSQGPWPCRRELNC